MHACVCLCVCVRERETDILTDRDKERQRQIQTERERDACCVLDVYIQHMPAEVSRGHGIPWKSYLPHLEDKQSFLTS